MHDTPGLQQALKQAANHHDRPRLAHFYELSEPRQPRPGDKAVCGHVCVDDSAEVASERCVVCEAMAS